MNSKCKVSSCAYTRHFSNHRFRQISIPITLVVLLSLALIPFIGSAQAAIIPSGFSDTVIASGLNLPTSMEIAPDGRIFVAEKGGNLRIIKNGVLLAQPFVSIPVSSDGERGLMGIAFDPNFSSNGYVYVFYTTQNDPTIHSRVSRFTADPTNPDRALAGSEVTILNLEPLNTNSHIGGAIEFGPDGKLYISTGDNYYSYLSQTLSSRFGKILRINSDGTIPSDNPFYNVQGAYKEIWARGLRNPFTFQFSSTGTMYIADVGQTAWEEINVGLAGANYGWPNCEGTCSNPQFVDPIYAYAHPPGGGGGGVGGASITGGPFYEASQFPAQYQGSYFFGDYVQGFIKRLTPTNQVVNFGTNLGTPVGIEVSPDGSLYYLTIFPGRVHKIQYSSTNSYPDAVVSANPSSGQAPLLVTFDGSGSSDLDGDTLSYSWNFGDGSPPQSGVSVQHTYDLAGSYTATLSVDDGNGVDTDSILITPGNPPVGTINTPAEGSFYDGGNTISFSGSATDSEDGTLPASAYEWTIAFHHNTHTHPFNQYSGVSSGSFNISTIGETSPDVWYRVYLTVTDSDGLTHTTFRDVLPNKSTVTIDTSVTGLNILLDGQPHTAPHTFEGVVGISRTLEAPNAQTLNGNTYNYVSWSDGGSRLHTIQTPATDTTFSATYVLDTSGNPPLHILTINSAYLAGNPITGLYHTIFDGSTFIESGWTIHTFPATEGITYTVIAHDYGNLIFDHWENGSLLRERDISLTSDTNITAYYRSASDPPPITYNLSVRSVDMAGNPITGYFTTIELGSAVLDTGFTPLTFLGQANQVYTVMVFNFGNMEFDHWEDGSTDRERVVTLTNDMIISASYINTNADNIPPTVLASPTGGTFLNSVDVTLSATDNADPSPVIYYTTDGSLVTTSSAVYTDPIGITTDTMLNFMAADSSGNVSPVSTQVYDITNPILTINSVNMAGNPISGYYTVIRQNGAIVQTGFTPVTFTGTLDESYTVVVGNYNGINFDHWESGDTSNPRTVVLNSDTTITASYINTNADNIPPTVLASPTGGTFLNSVDVTLSATDNADPSPVIYYTTDGSLVTTSSPVYTDPIGITTDTMLNFMAADSSGNVSPVSTEIYEITIPDNTPPTVLASPTGGTFLNSVDVTLSATDNADPSPVIYYTTDGSLVTTSSPVYAGSITIASDTTLNFMAADSSGNVSPVSTEIYEITIPDNTPPTVLASPTGGTFLNSVDVTLSATDNADPSPVIYYTTDGSLVTTSSAVYAGSITITSDTTLNFMAADSSGNVSPVSTEIYEITIPDNTPPTVLASPTGGTFLNSVDVTLSATDNADPSPVIYYTTDGSLVTTSSPVYTDPIGITTDTMLNFMAADSSGNVSPVSTEIYEITIPDNTPPTVLASPTGGTFLNSVDVTLSATDNADPSPVIYYTTDGSLVTTSSPVYTDPIGITTDTMLNFMAADSSGNVSPVSTEIYEITIPDNTPPTVLASPTGGTFLNSVDVTLSATDNADPSPVIYYTTDGSLVTTSSAVYAGSITITSDTTLNFMAADSSGNVSPVSTQVYLITTAPSAPTGLGATAVSPTQINLSWSAPSNNGGSPLTGYKIEVKVGTGSWSTLVANAGTGTTYSHTGLTSATLYTYRISAINSVGTSVPSAEASATTTQATVPVTQNNGQDSLLSSGWNGYVNLVKFTGLTPGSQIDAVAIKIASPAGNIRYKVYQDNGASGDPSTLLGQTNSVPAQAGTVYNSLISPVTVPSSGTVWVGFETDSPSMSAYHGSGVKKHVQHAFGSGPNPFGTAGANNNAIWAGIRITGSTQPPPSTAPSAPTGLGATAVSPTQINLSWSAPSNNGGSPLTGYKIEVKVGTGSWSTLVANAGTGTTYSHTGLTSATLYTYRISAINSVGTSVPSAEASATTTQATVPVTQNNGQDSLLSSGWNGYVNLVKFTGLTPGSQIDAVAIKIASPAGNIRYKVYQDNGASGDPSTLLGQTNSVPAQAGTVYNSLISPVTVPSSGTVWVGFETDSPSMSAYYGSGVKKHVQHAFGSGPNPFGTAGANNNAIWAGIRITG